MARKTHLITLRNLALADLLQNGTKQMSKAQLKVLSGWLDEKQSDFDYAFNLLNFIRGYIEQKKSAAKT